MVQMLRNWVCDQCDAERARQQVIPTGPYIDPDYELVTPKEAAATGDYEWANQQLNKGQIVEISACAHTSKGCEGWQYRYRRGNAERRHQKVEPQWTMECGLATPDFRLFTSPTAWKGHIFKIAKS